MFNEILTNEEAAHVAKSIPTRHQVLSIIFLWKEGHIDRFIPSVATSWTEADAQLLSWSFSSSKRGYAEKTDFRVEWENGEIWEGTCFLRHYSHAQTTSTNQISLGQHIVDFCSREDHPDELKRQLRHYLTDYDFGAATP